MSRRNVSLLFEEINSADMWEYVKYATLLQVIIEYFA